MTSSVNALRQRMYDEANHSVSAERLDSTSFSSSPAMLQSNQRSQTPVLSDAQIQSTSENEIEVKSTERERRKALHQTRKDLLETTGFDSYIDYMESFLHDPLYSGRSYFGILNGCFTNRRHIDSTGSGVDIIDLSSEDSSPVGVRIRCEDLAASEISRALCHPPPSTRAQIVLWPIDRYGHDIKDFLDILGVGLQLDPCFFEAFRYRKDDDLYDQHFRSKKSLSISSIGTSVFVARSFVLAQDNPVPVVLIAGPMYKNVNEFIGQFSFKEGAAVCHTIYDLVQAAPLYVHYKCDGIPSLANAYIRALSSLLKSTRDSVPNSSDTLSACVIPLLQIEIAIYKGEFERLKSYCEKVKQRTLRGYDYEFRKWGNMIVGTQELSDGEAIELLYGYRAKLRSWVEYFENGNGALMGLLTSLYGPSFTEGVFYPQMKEARISIIEEARRLEAEIRDHLQLQGSQLALEESKKSIELSNRQIDESKRLKIFTVLAFFYIPLNLATSVFGMNLQQLNSSGTSIGIFLGTAVMFLFLTGVSWFILERVQDVRVWVRRFDEDRASIINGKEKQSIYVRLYLVWWLSRNNLFVWMIRTGAGWCILTNSHTTFQPWDSLYHMSKYTATTFVMTMIQRENWRTDLNADKGRWLFKRNVSDSRFLPIVLCGK